MPKADIVKFLIDMDNKIRNSYRGRVKYGYDYNILKAVIENRDKKDLLPNLVRSLRDKLLASKVEKWMLGG